MLNKTKTSAADQRQHNYNMLKEVGEKVNMDIMFTSKNGLAPYYNDTKNNIKYYIQDHNVGGVAHYDFMYKLLVDKFMFFDNTEKLKEFIENKIQKHHFTVEYYSNYYAYFTVDTIYKVEDLKLTFINNWNIYNDFYSYNDCLQYAKEYILKVLLKTEPEQLCLL